MSALRLLGCSFACLSSLWAQGTTAGTAPTQPARSESARVAERAQEMRENLEVGAPTATHMRVALRLRNGNRLQGLVRDGRLAERVDGRQFVEARANDTGAGVRIWSATGGRDYVFVSFRDIAEYQVLQRLSQRQLEQLERDVQVPGERPVEAIRPSSVTVPGGEMETIAGGTPPPAAGGEAVVPIGELPPVVVPVPVPVVPGVVGGAVAQPKPGEDAQHKEWFALLQEFPPASGFGKEKRDEIARRFVVVGTQPSAAELRFVEKFDDWQKACEFFGVKAAPVAVVEEPSAEPRAQRRTSGRASERAAAESESAVPAEKPARAENGKRSAARSRRGPTTEEGEAEGQGATEESTAEPRSNRRR